MCERTFLNISEKTKFFLIIKSTDRSKKKGKLNFYSQNLGIFYTKKYFDLCENIFLNLFDKKIFLNYQKYSCSKKRGIKIFSSQSGILYTKNIFNVCESIFKYF